MIRNAVIENQSFDLTGQHLVCCYFENCTLTLNHDATKGDTTVDHCTITRCTLVGDGWPPETIGPGHRTIDGEIVVTK